MRNASLLPKGPFFKGEVGPTASQLSSDSEALQVFLTSVAMLTTEYTSRRQRPIFYVLYFEYA